MQGDTTNNCKCLAAGYSAGVENPSSTLHFILRYGLLKIPLILVGEQ